MTRRICPVPGCPTITDGGRCAPHRAQLDQQRGTRQQRGYTAEHDRLRAQLDPIVQAGHAVCMRCGHPLTPDPITGKIEWDLGHTDDRTAWTGPECPACNRAAGGRSAHLG